MFKKLIPALLLSVMAASANATVVDYTMTLNGAFATVGQFSGTDNNTDGFLAFDELSAFSLSVPVAALYLDLTTVSDFGRYDIGQNTWLHDAAGWGRTDFAYVSFNDGNLSVNPVNASQVVTRIAQAPSEVPEPASLALLAFGLLGLGAARRASK